MADTAVNIKDFSGTSVPVDGFSMAGGDIRQAMVIGDPVTAANVASVDPTFGMDVAVSGQQGATTTGTITTSSSAVPASALGWGNATIRISGTYAGVSVVFQASDDSGTTYGLWQVVRESDGQVLTSDVLATNATVFYTVDLPGITNFRVLATAYTSGTANVRITPGGMAFMPVVSIGNNLCATAPVPTTVSVTTSATQIIAADPNRRGVILWNNSSVTALIALGAATPTAALSSFPLQPQQVWESQTWNGRIAGITAAGTASVNVTPVLA